MKFVRYNYLIISLFFITSIIFYSCSEDDSSEYKPIAFGSITDIDGNVYNTITIEIPDGPLKSTGGIQTTTQTWMVENLKTTKYSNGDSIKNVTIGEDWCETTSGAYCHYNNDPDISETYGLLYNWYAVTDERNIAPEGWHVPTEAEWMTLINYLGGFDVAGGKLKEAGTTHWIEPNTGADNIIDFTALPGGYRYGGFGGNGSFYNVDSCGYFWTSTQDPADRFGVWAWRVGLYLTSRGAWIDDSRAETGYSVRCIMD